MTEKQVFSAIERNKCCVVQISDFAGNTLGVIEGNSPQHIVSDLSEILCDYRGYKKLQIKAVEKKGTPWSKGYTWQLEFDKTEDGNTKVSAIGAIPHGAISPSEYIAMFTTMMEKQMTLQTTILEKQAALNNNDPAKWLPIIQTVGPALGLSMGTAPSGIAGPPGTATGAAKKDLHFVDDVDTTNFTDEQFTNVIGEKLNKLATKISGPQMLRLMSALEKDANIKSHIDDITTLIQAVSANPSLLKAAIAWITPS